MQKKFFIKIISIIFIFLTLSISIYYYSFHRIEKWVNNKLKMSYISLANSYAIQNSTTLAIENYQKALKLDPENLEALIGYGKESLKEGEIQPLYFKKVLEKNPSNKEANFYMGLISLDKPEIAKKYLALSEDFDTKKKEVIINYLNTWPLKFNSILYKRLLISQIDIAIGENNLAINLLLSIVQEKPDYRDAWTLLGQAYFSQGKKNKALECFDKALALDGDNEYLKDQILKLKNTN